jgi:sugar O-acyltransferase (sialic acid O-acetyltransferase NeuD family)
MINRGYVGELMQSLKEKKVIIIGGGGHSKVLLDCLLLSGASIIGITDIDSKNCHSNCSKVKFIGKDEAIFHYNLNDILLVNGLGFTDKSNRRAAIFELFKNQGYSFASVIHPSAIISNDVVLSEGVQVMAGSVIQPGCVIGANSIINTSVTIDHDCIIAKNVHIAPGAVLSGNVTVELSVFVGAGSTILPGVNISSGSIVGAGALVNKNILANSKVYGVPAKVVSS